MKAMTKQQLADHAGVSVKTLSTWCRPYQNELRRMGFKPRMKVLPPNIVAYLAERLCIDLGT